MKTTTVTRLAFAAALWFPASGPAAAHHAMGGRTPATFMEGLLSGIGHPVIGVDHLAFIIALGLAASFVSGGWGIVAAFLAASTLGVLAHVVELGVPLVEPLIAASVVVAGAAIAAGKARARGGWLLLAAVAGLLHGYAFGEAAVGAERDVIGAYLIGLALIQAAIAGIVIALSRWLSGTAGEDAMPLRAAGAVLASLGIILLAGGLIGT